jgi:hypothetical protein
MHNRRPVYQWLRRFLWTRPGLYRFVNLARRRRDFYTENFDICIAGFPRSANSYLWRMLEITQPGISIKSHHHHPAVAIHAIRLGKPVLFLLRNPEDSIPSFCIHQNRSVDWVLDYYIAFHRIILPFCDQMLLATFEEISSNFKSVLQKLNERFSLSLTRDFDEDVARQRAFDIIERCVTDDEGRVDHRRLHIPSDERSPLKAELLEQLRAPALRADLKRALHLYNIQLELASKQKAVEASHSLNFDAKQQSTTEDLSQLP